jgi:putative transposase
MADLTGSYFEEKLIRVCVQWYLQYPLSYRQIEEMLHERGLMVHHATLNRWVLKFSAQLQRTAKSRKPPDPSAWTLEESHVKIKGDWKYLYQALDSAGQTIDFVLLEARNSKAARSFLQKVIKQRVWCAVPSSVTGRTQRHSVT